MGGPPLPSKLPENIELEPLPFEDRDLAIDGRNAVDFKAHLD